VQLTPSFLRLILRLYDISVKSTDMSRIFTVTFSYRGRDCSALISLRKERGDLEVHVRFFEPDFYLFFPNGLVYLAKEGYKSLPQYQHTGAREVMEGIGMAIEPFLKEQTCTD
jgi:hypothetical protein